MVPTPPREYGEVCRDSVEGTREVHELFTVVEWANGFGVVA